MKYAFVLGSHPELSKLEIFQVLTKQKIGFDVLFNENEFLILELNELPKGFLQNLGGTIKIVKLFEQIFKVNDFKNKASKFVLDFFEQNNLQERVNFGFSLYIKTSISNFKVHRLSRIIFQTGLQVKAKLKNFGIKTRFIISKKQNLSSVIVQNKKLLYKNNSDFCFFYINDKKILIGKTLEVQDFKLYSKFDYGRPKRDSRSGMLPFKLAKILVNLSACPKNKILLDPFCGSGTILVNAYLLGIKKIIGSDISLKAVKDSKENLAWIQNFTPNQNIEISIFQQDVCDLHKTIEQKVSAIVTEPYLGTPNYSKLVDKNFLLKQIKDLESLYFKSFKEFAQILQKHCFVVFIFPVFNIKKNVFFINILDKIQKLGFKVYTPFDNFIKYSKRKSLFYSRKNQIVGREIFIFKKL